MRLILLTVFLVGAVMPVGPTATAQPGARHGEGRTLQRPTDSGAEDAFDVAPELQRRADTPHFRIHWTDEGIDRATTAYVKQVAVTLEEVWRVEIDELGWPRPLGDDGLGGRAADGRDLVDVYLIDLDDGPYGYAAADAENPCDVCRSVYGYLVLENDYAGYEPNPIDALRSTSAHEFGHLIQMRIAWDAEPWAYEATAVWLERAVYPAADARTAYLVDFASRPDVAVTDFSETLGGFDRSYGLYVWNLYLAARFGPDVVRDSWLFARTHRGHMLEGYAEAIRAAGSSLDQVFVEFAAATASWEVGGFPGEPLDYPSVSRQAPLGSGETREIQLDHTATFLADLNVGDRTTITVRGPRHVAGGIAVVASGSGQVLAQVDHTLFDGQATVALDGIGQAGRVTLVVANADRALARPKTDGSDFAAYLNDDVTFVIGVDTDPGPPPKQR